MVCVETDDETANELSLPYLIEGLIRCAIDERALTDRQTKAARQLINHIVRGS